MSEERRFTLNEAQLEFAKKINGLVWKLLEKPDRSKDEDWEMLHASHASLYHWLQVGTGLHRQRGEWLVSRVRTVLGNGNEAVVHATRCLELTEYHNDLMEDFDFAFAYESAARANALAGNSKDSEKLLSVLNRREKPLLLRKIDQSSLMISMEGTGTGCGRIEYIYQRLVLEDTGQKTWRTNHCQPSAQFNQTRL